MVSILSLNTKGLVSHHKQLALQEFSKHTDSSIILLQETNLSPESSFVVPSNFHYFLNSPVQAQSGVAIAFKEEIYKEATIISHTNLVPGYLQALNFNLKQQDYHLINVYMPHVNATAIQVINHINGYVNKIKEDSIIVVAGDWNLTLHEEDRRNCSEIRTQLVSDIKIIFNQNNLTDVWREFYPLKRQFTYKGLQHTHPMARLDRFYMRSKDLHLVSGTSITPSFSDHSAITLKLNITTQKYKPPYWKFQPDLLHSEEYQQIINNIIQHFEELSQEPSCNITSLWEKLKEEVKVASQRFSYKIKGEEKEQLTILKSQINYIDSKEQLSRSDEKNLLLIEKEIANLYKESASEKLKLLESQVLKEANTQSKYFLRLARQTKPSSTISQLEINGQVTDNKSQIFQAVHDQYKNIFSNQDSHQINPSSILYENLPKLSPTSRDSCEQQITIEEIEESIKNAQLNRAPGIDGLPIEFYKFFWEKIQHLMEKLFKNFHDTGELPKSMKKVIIAPAPKKGDRLNLSNWRPIALLNTDYKILSRIYSKRISNVVSTLLDSDQSYCVPNRTICNNLHVIRNIIRDSNRRNNPLAILALDQAGAFNRVSHKYLLHLLKAHGFGPNLCNAIFSLLNNTFGHVKIGSSLLAAFLFEVGFRQGDPLAGPLYIISIEPFLRITLKSINLKGYTIPRPKIKFHSTAFADDIHFFITDNNDFQKIPEAFQIYSEQSGALLNQNKCTGLFCGQWKNREDHPLDCQWSSEGIKALGIHIGNTATFEEKNWESLIIKMKGTLNNWSQYVKLTSYQGRKIICNQLAGAQLIHVLNILQPPQKFILEIQKIMVNFLWQGKHWVHPNFVFAPQEKGGLGLTHLGAKINSLRLKLSSNLQNNYENQDPVNQLHHYQMSMYGRIHPYHFFSQEKNIVEMNNLDPFYQSLLTAWHNINPALSTSRFPLSIIRHTPLYGSQIVNPEELKIIPDWKKCNFNSIEDLMNDNGIWKTLQISNFSSTIQRRITYNFNQIKVYFNRKIERQEDNSEHIKIDFKFQDPNQDKPRNFPAQQKILYQASLNFFLRKPEITGKIIWLDKKINWNPMYQYPIDKKDGDVSWRLMHNALVTPKKLNQWNIIPSQKCPWCNHEGNVMHMIFHCDKTTPLWNFISQKVRILNQSLSLTHEEALIGFPPTTPSAKLANFLLTLGKSTIYRTYTNVIKEESPLPPSYLAIFKRRIQYRLALEYHHASLTKTENKFKEIFMINNALSLNLN